MSRGRRQVHTEEVGPIGNDLLAFVKSMPSHVLPTPLMQGSTFVRDDFVLWLRSCKRKDGNQ